MAGMGLLQYWTDISGGGKNNILNLAEKKN
jgi:hypothetical protein